MGLLNRSSEFASSVILITIPYNTKSVIPGIDGDHPLLKDFACNCTSTCLAHDVCLFSSAPGFRSVVFFVNTLAQTYGPNLTLSIQRPTNDCPSALRMCYSCNANCDQLPVGRSFFDNVFLSCFNALNYFFSKLSMNHLCSSSCNHRLFIEVRSAC